MQNFVLTHVRVKTDPYAVLLVLKDRPEYLKGRFNLVGGKIEEGEYPIDAARRELMEESGLTVGKIEPCGRIDCNGYSIYCFSTVVDTKIPIVPIDGETEYVAWYNWKDMVNDKRLMPNLKVTVPLMSMDSKNWIIEDNKKSSIGIPHEIKIKIN